MNRRTFLKSVPALTILAAARPNFTQAVKEKTESYGEAVKAALPPTDIQPIALIPPQTEGGKSVLAALKERKTIRTFAMRNFRRRCFLIFSGRPGA